MSVLTSRRVGLLFTVALALSLFSAPVATADDAIRIGVHAGVPDGADMDERVEQYETLIQRDVDVVNVFKGFSQTYLVPDSPSAAPTEEMRLLQSGHTVMISWRAHEGCGTGPSSTPRAQRDVRASELAAGDHDAGLREMAEQLDRLSAFGPVLLRFHWEMDQEPGGCQYIGSPSEYVAAWRHVHDVVSQIAPAVDWVWAPRANSFNKGENYDGTGRYVFDPGAAHYDMVGGSAVPRSADGQEGAWRGPAEIFDAMVSYAAARNRPALVWVGVREKTECLRSGGCDWEPDVRWKADFIDDLRALGAGSWANTLGILVWYHDLSPFFDDVYDFRVNTSTRARDAMRTLVCDAAFGGCGTGGGGGSSGDGSGGGGSSGGGSDGGGASGGGSDGGGASGGGSGGSSAGGGSTGGTSDRFTDDNTSVHEASIEWLAAAGITLGCNPPSNTRFCPDDPVTRAQMATFLDRALGLADGQEQFTDVGSGDTHARSIGALARAGITIGCNPPSNTRFCPDDPVTRAQMATFLDRALGLADGQEQFTDVGSGDTHARSIGALARAGITIGCNPPSNTRYCPDDAVTRGQMATFIERALG